MRTYIKESTERRGLRHDDDKNVTDRLGDRTYGAYLPRHMEEVVA